MPIAAAADAARVTDTISQGSVYSALWPRTTVEAAAFALSFVSVTGGLLVAAFGVYALYEYRKKR